MKTLKGKGGKKSLNSSAFKNEEVMVEDRACNMHGSLGPNRQYNYNTTPANFQSTFGFESFIGTHFSQLAKPKTFKKKKKNCN